MSPLDLFQRHLEAFNSRDEQAEPWAQNATLIAPGGSAEGRDGVLGFLRVFHEGFSDGRLETVAILSEGTRAAVEGRFVGTHDGVLHTPAGDVPATGRAVSFRWAALYETSEDELRSEHLYFDQMDLLGQLGLLPA